MKDSIGRTGRHSEFCEGHITCPNTGKEECGKVMILQVWSNGEESASQILCFGCGEQHRVSSARARLKLTYSLHLPLQTVTPLKIPARISNNSKTAAS